MAKFINMARKYLIPFLSLLSIALMAFALQAHAPSLYDFLNWFSLVSLFIGGLLLVTGLLILPTHKKKLAKEFLFSALLVLVIAAGIYLAIVSQHRGNS